MIKNNSKIFIISNWKANPSRILEAKKIFESLKKIKINTKKIVPIICSPSVFFESLAKKYRGNVFKFGAQNIPVSENSEQTGEILIESLKDFNIQYTIIGHSERRRLGETNEIVNQKIKNALNHKIIPIVCIGEEIRDVQGEYLRFLERQIKETFAGLDKKQITDVIITYEPVWAIGEAGHAINHHDLNQTVLYIKKILVHMFDRKIGLSAIVLYGGSVDNENITDLLSLGDVDGVLIGRASVNPSVYAKIIKQINNLNFN